MTHTSRRRALAAAVTALLALAPSALAAHRAPQPPHHPSAVAGQPGALTGTHAHTPSDINPAYGAYTPGSIRAVSYSSGTTTRAVNEPASGVYPTTVGLGIAGSLLAIASVVGLARHSRRTRRARISA